MSGHGRHCGESGRSRMGALWNYQVEEDGRVVDLVVYLCARIRVASGHGSHPRVIGRHRG